MIYPFYFAEITDGNGVCLMIYPFYFAEITDFSISIKRENILKVNQMTFIEDKIYDFDGFCIGEIIEKNATGLGVVLGTGIGFSASFDIFITFVEKKDPFSYKLLQVPANIDIIRFLQEACSEPVDDIQYLKDIMEFV